ncbi:MAG: hypothetical protein WC613_06130 [Candidatus Aenigmatarchaeota archaeon]
MPLTAENMKVDPNGKVWDTATLVEDINQMSIEQLARYVRLAFVGETDPEFLPPRSYFWRAFSIHGSDDGTYSPTPGNFFAGIYMTVPDAYEGKFTRSDGSKITVYPEYRSRFERVLKDIFEECLKCEGKPKQRELMLTRYALEAIDRIRSSDGPNSPVQQFSEALKERGIVPASEIPEMLQKLEPPKDDKNELFQLAKKLLEDPRYSTS